MAGETRADISGWTVDTLHAHIRDIIDERDRRYEQRFVDQLSANQKALASAQLAVTKAELAVEKRLENTNEWRAAMNDRDIKLLPRTEFLSILTEWANWRRWLEKDHAEVKTRLTTIETKLIVIAASTVVFFTIIQAVLFWFQRIK